MTHEEIQEWFDNLKIGDKVIDSQHRIGNVYYININNKYKPGVRKYRIVYVEFESICHTIDWEGNIHFSPIKRRFHAKNGSIDTKGAYTFDRLYPPETIEHLNQND